MKHCNELRSNATDRELEGLRPCRRPDQILTFLATKTAPEIDGIFDSVLDRPFSSKISPKVPKMVAKVVKIEPKMLPKSFLNRIFSKNVKTLILNYPLMVLLDFSCSGVRKIDVKSMKITT